jgi:hypothetical protein
MWQSATQHKYILSLSWTWCRALHTHLQPKAAEEYQPLQMLHARKMVIDILDDPSNFFNHTITWVIPFV